MSQQKRRWFRMQVPAGQEFAELRVGQRKLSVRLIDESVGGFAVICDHPLDVQRGTQMILRTPAGWHRVQVVRIEEFSDAMLLGMARLADLDHPDDVAETQLAGWRYLCFSSLRQKLLPDGSMSLSGSAFVAIAMVGILVGGFFLAGYKPPKNLRQGFSSIAAWASWKPAGPVSPSNSSRSWNLQEMGRPKIDAPSTEMDTAGAAIDPGSAPVSASPPAFPSAKRAGR